MGGRVHGRVHGKVTLTLLAVDTYMVQVVRATEKVLELGLDQPLMKILAGLEHVLKKAQVHNNGCLDCRHDPAHLVWSHASHVTAVCVRVCSTLPVGVGGVCQLPSLLVS